MAAAVSAAGVAGRIEGFFEIADLEVNEQPTGTLQFCLRSAQVILDESPIFANDEAL